MAPRTHNCEGTWGRGKAGTQVQAQHRAWERRGSPHESPGLRAAPRKQGAPPSGAHPGSEQRAQGLAAAAGASEDHGL